MTTQKESTTVINARAVVRERVQHVARLQAQGKRIHHTAMLDAFVGAV